MKLCPAASWAGTLSSLESPCPTPQALSRLSSCPVLLRAGEQPSLVLLQVEVAILERVALPGNPPRRTKGPWV